MSYQITRCVESNNLAIQQHIVAGLIIPGDGNPIENGVLTINTQTGKIESITPESKFYFKNKQASNIIKVPILMPGLWDCHIHFGGINKEFLKYNNNSMDLLLLGQMQPGQLCVARCIPHLTQSINYGITSVRDCGGYGLYLKKLVEEGTFIGPNIYACGQALSITGGHGDVHQLPLNFVCYNCRVLSNSCSTIVDGVSECLKETRNQLRNSADFIKIHATGGVLSLNDSFNNSQFGENEIKTVVDECKRHKKIVAAHCHGLDGIKHCIENGVHSIEHGTFLTKELALEMNKNNMVLIPTRWINEYINENIEKPDVNWMSNESKIKFKKVLSSQRNSLRIAIDNGVKICMGTDMGLDEWGQNATELEHYVNLVNKNGQIEKGMSELEAIKCATANGPYCLGNNKDYIPKSGQIKVGFDADLIALSKNPLNDITCLQNEQNIKIVWKQGKILKNLYLRKSKI